MAEKLDIDIPILLPEVGEGCERCVANLSELIAGRRGVEDVHTHSGAEGGQLCVHYDPDLISLAEVQRLAREAGAEVSQRFRHEVMRVAGMDCTDCSLSLEHSVGRLPGILSVSVNYAAQRMRVEYDAATIERDSILQRVRGTGYEVVEEERERGWVRENWELVLSLLSGLFLAAGWAGERFLGLPPLAAAGLYGLAYLTGGFNTMRHGVGAIVHGHFDIDVLMGAAALGAAALGEWAEGALLLFLFSLGHALEEYATDRARNAIRALGDLSPKTARVRRQEMEFEIGVDDVWLDDVAIVRPGERVPVDGEVVRGRSTVDQSPITGESVPVEKRPGDEVFAGSINAEGSLEVRVTKLAQDTTLARVVRMVEEAPTRKSPMQHFTERFERAFVPAILGGVVLVMLLPPLAGWLTWETSILRGLTILVAASPCALAIATPSAVLAGVAQAARNGVLVKGGMHLENLGALAVIAFDKTGTITLGRPQVTDLVPTSEVDEGRLLLVAASVETQSRHPLAQAIVREATARELALAGASELEAMTGRGVRAMLDGDAVLIGTPRLFDEQAVAVAGDIRERAGELERAGKTVVLVARAERLLGIIALADTPRVEARATIEALERLGIKRTVMLTGDTERVAEAIARDVGISDYRANLLPEDKAAAVDELVARYGELAMVGDGVNDAPALAHATVGIAMGGAGSDVALETADVALMGDDLTRLPFAVALSHRTRRIIRQNLWISLGVIALLIPTGLFGLVGIGIAVLLHEGSTLVVVANALRLLGFGGRVAPRAVETAKNEGAEASPFRKCPDDAVVCPVVE
jgi:Cd2+/Zn2+-exporting ATPase